MPKRASENRGVRISKEQSEEWGVGGEGATPKGTENNSKQDQGTKGKLDILH